MRRRIALFSVAAAATLSMLSGLAVIAQESGPGSLKASHDIAPSKAPVREPMSPELPGTPAPRNVVLITLDTTRADHLSCYGHSVRTSPNIDALAAAGVRFEHATAVIPLTGPGHGTILTGLYPRDHGAIRNGVPTIPAASTLQTLLSSRGFDTAAFVSGWTLRSNLSGLGRGFATYDDEMTDRYQLVNNQRPGDETMGRALQWLDGRDHRAGEPFFLWVHLFDPHDPYKAHGFELESIRPAPKQPRKLRDYDQEIYFADLQVGRLLRRLDELALRESTLIVLTSDHGEAFGEHGENGHGRKLYETTQHVPLIITHPAFGRARVSDLPVSTIDITPTILGALGLPLLPEMQGIPLGAALDAPGSFAGRSLLLETFPGARKGIWKWFTKAPTGKPIAVAVRRGDWKAIMDTASGRLRLFDLSLDPGEMQDVSVRQTIRAGRFEPILAAHAARTWRGNGDGVHLTEDDRRRLESLGYIR